jgi:pumilio RNA-binding family
VTESPLAMPSEKPMRDSDLEPYRSESAPPLLHCNGAVVQNGAQNRSYLLEELRSDMAYRSYHSNANLNPRLPQPRQSRKDWSSVYQGTDGGNLSGGGVREGGRLNHDGREGNGSGFCMGGGFGERNDLGEIFQVSLFFLHV